MSLILKYVGTLNRKKKLRHTWSRNLCNMYFSSSLVYLFGVWCFHFYGLLFVLTLYRCHGMRIRLWFMPSAPIIIVLWVFFFPLWRDFGEVAFLSLWSNFLSVLTVFGGFLVILSVLLSICLLALGFHVLSHMLQKK